VILIIFKEIMKIIHFYSDSLIFVATSMFPAKRFMCFFNQITFFEEEILAVKNFHRILVIQKEKL